MMTDVQGSKGSGQSSCPHHRESAPGRVPPFALVTLGVYDRSLHFRTWPHLSSYYYIIVLLLSLTDKSHSEKRSATVHGFMILSHHSYKVEIATLPKPSRFRFFVQSRSPKARQRSKIPSDHCVASPPDWTPSHPSNSINPSVHQKRKNGNGNGNGNWELGNGNWELGLADLETCPCQVEF